MNDDSARSQTTRAPILQRADEWGSAYDALMPSEVSQPRIVALAREIDRLRFWLTHIASHDDGPAGTEAQWALDGKEALS